MKEQKKKERLDMLLVRRALAESREKAKRLIMAGNVFVNDQREDKAGSMFSEDVQIELKGTPMKYVSRGGYKLEKAVDLWEVPLEGKVCMDVGSSTGGFTDCMLQNGAKKVYAVDVGTNQLAWKLRQDERVISMEKTNIRYVTREEVPEEIAFSSIDVAFISLTKVLFPVKNLLGARGRVVCLVKPQFEAGREKVGKKGVVRDKEVHVDVVCKIMEYACEIGFTILSVDYSPIKGPEGNIEYLLYLEKAEQGEDAGSACEKEWDVEGGRYQELAREVVTAAHNEL
ncbi:MAG: TlyA family RNA methyltransferase [Lachnospiraceae bacterium]|jgi:23S rRNA (cytidine1920-2'-O)/16S rRNA (cytidine1409-2'-O)-methyltransferase|nr:TlyA family RNA methyltransferase [Lachnospiraceae bacterium]